MSLMYTISFHTLIQGKYFINPKFAARSCDCGDVFSISVERAIYHLNLDIAGEAICNYVASNAIGHNGMKVSFADGQRLETHIHRNAYPKAIIDALDNGNWKFKHMQEHSTYTVH